jgi:hypothetical protein
MSYHHIESIASATEILSSHLKPKGSLIVIDILKVDNVDMDELFPEHKDNLVAHRGGFTVEDIKKAFLEAGLSFEFLPSIPATKEGRAMSLFVAKGCKRPASE